eukprot:1161677-Pelagomonas_calceolata.AAC.17
MGGFDKLPIVGKGLIWLVIITTKVCCVESVLQENRVSSWTVNMYACDWAAEAAFKEHLMDSLQRHLC